MSAEAPVPPPDLIGRVGVVDKSDTEIFLWSGQQMREEIDELLGNDWSWEHKSVLDFGCGAGRLTRHLLDVAAAGTEVSACDVDPQSMEWVRENLVPPLAAAPTTEMLPPLPFKQASFDLVLATSVFTHIDLTWAPWLVELRRVLKPGGLFLASFLGPAMSKGVAGEPWDEELVGANVHISNMSTNVLHSPWWLRAHWGRAFEILELRESGFAAPSGEGEGQGVLLGRRRDVKVTAEELFEPEPGEPREFSAAAHNVRKLRLQAAQLEAQLQAAVLDAAAAREELARLRRERGQLGQSEQ